MGNIKVYYNYGEYPSLFEDVDCKRWDEDNWGAIIEFFCTASSRNNIFDNVVPGAYRELYNVLGTPKFIDSTWSDSNTLVVEPKSGYGISSLREGHTYAVKSAQDSFINPNYFNVKLELIRIDI